MTKTSSLPQPADRSQERGRPREFDLDEVVDSAGRVFWEGGYHATSVGTLCDATGLLRGSLYGAFGDKHGLLIAAFERYADGAVARLKERLAADLPPRECLREALLHYTRLSADLAGRHGCFITNAALELLPADEVLRPYIETTLQRIGAQLTAAVGADSQQPLFTPPHATHGCRFVEPGRYRYLYSGPSGTGPRRQTT
ncbi:MAG: TetR family transcriptional regulator [Caballeronia sp.]|jgi:TetR/AcrR family transcriptional repressor of nem operon|uniref:TetR/AcrR family transcriptional regulator n=1 Tax=Caballeronia sp. TaxID=1931223 RepID=UPI002614261E|nr:TetR/AcrR family transcriptional regulator [Caballeronia sp.]MDB5832351.1 TetR family transcriptional regulator [Caballeronia sp.]